MKSILLILAIFLFSKVEAHSSFVYGNVHALSGYPTVGIGIRNQYDYHGFDVSLSCLPATAIFHGRAFYLFYPNGERCRGFYFGGGLGCLNEPESTGFSESFESALGYQWRTKRGRQMFFQIEVFGPFREPKAKVGRIWPGLTYGFQF